VLFRSLLLLCFCFILSRAFSGKLVESSSDSEKKFRLRNYVESSLRPLKNLEHVTVFAIKQRNLDKLEKILYDVSDPSSDNYGEHLNRSEVADLTANAIATKAVLDYLASQDVTVLNQTIYGEYIIVNATIGVWESILRTKFVNFKSMNDQQTTVIRATRYYMPSEIVDHVSAIFNVLDFPIPSKFVKSFPIPKKSPSSSTGTYNGYITPQVLNTYYKIFYNQGNNLASQSVYSGLNQYFSSSDLAAFATQYGIPQTVSVSDPNSRNSNSACLSNPDSCGESNLDLEYLMAIAQNIPTTIIYETDGTNNGFLNWITTTANMVNPPLVHSMSYGADEGAYPSVANSFNTEAMKLGVMGVTILVSSGDNGVGSNSGSCGYTPSFPATSPYVTAVGATKGAESGGPEVVCQWDGAGVITSGGGFSTLYTAPAFQSSAISNYLSTVSTKPVSGYSTTGRGYPDVSLAGYAYQTIIGGHQYSSSGTSASAPAFAAMVSLVNAVQRQAGMPSLGWLNPAIYASGGSFTNDITSGNNKCTMGNCCSQGFYAAPGWDPVTGFGSVDFTKFYAYFATSKKPTAAPTVFPSMPTMKPSAFPSMPTLSPSTLPTNSPTVLSQASCYASAPDSYSSSMSVNGVAGNKFTFSSPLTVNVVYKWSVTPVSYANVQWYVGISGYGAQGCTYATGSYWGTITFSLSQSLSSAGCYHIFSSAQYGDNCWFYGDVLDGTRIGSIWIGGVPSARPTAPTSKPSVQPSTALSRPSTTPTSKPSVQPSAALTSKPSMQPVAPTAGPSKQPTAKPSQQPSALPSSKPTVKPSTSPTTKPTLRPTAKPSQRPSALPTSKPTVLPSSPTSKPTVQMTAKPSQQPSALPTGALVIG